MKFEEWKELIRQQWKELAEKRREGMTHSEIHNHESQLGTMSKNDPEYGQTHTITYNVTGNFDVSNLPTEIKSTRTLKLNIPIPYGAIGSVDANVAHTYEDGVLTIQDVQQDIEIAINITDVLYENAKLGDYLYDDWTFGPTEKAGYLGRCVGVAINNEGKSVWCSPQSSSNMYWSTEDKNTGINDFANANAAKTDFGGKANTELLLSLGKDKYPAAKWASEQFQGNGYLPAVGELYKCCAEIKLYVYSGVVYSSTEKDSACAWTTSTNNKAVGNYQKRAYSYRIVSFLQLSGKPGNPKYNGHEYVEIGGLKWATMNVGATSETDAGLYFQWGDTQGYTADQVGNGEGQKYFDWTDYKWTEDGGSTMTKYNETDGKTVLEAADDAAVANWGGSWRMPTIAELQALGDAVNTEWTNDYQGSGIAGLVCTDKTDSSKILFFPAVGNCYDGNVRGVGNFGIYYLSSLFVDGDLYSDSFYFESGYADWEDSSNWRYFGYPVRPVAD